MAEERVDALIVGASFAGLAAAGALDGAGRVLVIDREPPGAGETSACGTVLAVLERLDALDALQQVHPDIVVHAAGRAVVVHPSYPFATFDYATLCRILASRLRDVEIRTARFEGVEDGAVVAGGRRIRAEILMDATGARSQLARAFGAPEARNLSFGLEARHGHGGCDLEFWVRPEERPDGVFWAFPAGGHVREGVASYLGRTTGMRRELERFTHEHDFGPRAVHGGFFSAGLRDPVAGRIFVLGDAAGLCLPLTGEGIRPALVWGQVAGRQARRVLEGNARLEEALAAYRAAILAHRWEYRILEMLQRGLLRAPLPLLPTVVRLFASGPVARIAQRAYWQVAPPDLLEVTPGVRSGTRAPALKCAVHAPGACHTSPVCGLNCTCDKVSRPAGA